MRKLLFILALLALTSSVFAGGYITHRMQDGMVLSFKRHIQTEQNPVGSLPMVPPNPNRLYRVPVILFSFADCDFSCQDPRQFYDDLFNKPGYNLGKGPGCVADYFRDQSHGLFNVRFDIIGPVKLSTKQKSTNEVNYGTSQFVEAVKAVDGQVNFADYVWENDVPTVLFIYAGYGGNELAEECQRCIMPNTGGFNMRADGVKLTLHSASNEIWSNHQFVGIGTICHEYCHTFGIPDFYPSESEHSVLDEWDLMDGGCYAGDGWCPVNLSIHQRELLKWQSPVDLTTSTVVTDMPPFNEGGMAYRIVNDAHPAEHYLLENRQQVGWDLMLPGHGLLVAHVDFNEAYWSNSVNIFPNHHRYDYFHADGLAFSYYKDKYGITNVYDADGRSIRLQHTAYPYTDSSGVVHDALTDTTIPAATLFNANRDGRFFMGKPITDIQETNGLISFRFSDTPDAITTLSVGDNAVTIYDLQGHVVQTPSRGLYIIKYPDGTTKKVLR